MTRHRLGEKASFCLLKIMQRQRLFVGRVERKRGLLFYAFRNKNNIL